MTTLRLVILFFATTVGLSSFAQDDKSKLAKANVFATDTTQVATTPTRKQTKDSIALKKHSPQKATLRSAILPGWGQFYNKEPLWRIALVYGALGTATGIYIYNNSWYQRTKKAYTIVANNDTANFPSIDSRLAGLDASRLQFYRNEFRKDRDYAMLWFLLTWGLNVVDATVYGHLKHFDVSDNLAMEVNPSVNPINKSTGVSLVFSFKKTHKNIVAVK
jgi:Family of unknown function (DUF5683)